MSQFTVNRVKRSGLCLHLLEKSFSLVLRKSSQILLKALKLKLQLGNVPSGAKPWSRRCGLSCWVVLPTFLQKENSSCI